MMKKSAFNVNKPEDSPGFLLWQVTITWQRMIKKALSHYDISHAQFVILAILLWFEEIQQEPTQILIARQSKLDKMTVSKAIKQLVTRGLVKCSEHTEDTRAKVVKLTTKGKLMTAKWVKIVEKTDKAFFNAINQKDQRALLVTLNKLMKQNTEYND